MFDFDTQLPSSPGETIIDILEERNLSLKELADLMEVPYDFTILLVKSSVPINDLIASKLERVLGSTASFWLKRDEIYRKELLRLSKLIPSDKSSQ